MIQSFADLIAPMSSETFFEKYLGRVYHHFPGPADKYSDVISWQEINQIIVSHWSDDSVIRVAQNGQPMQKADYTVRYGTRERFSLPAFAAALQAGATLVIEGSEVLHDKIMAIVMCAEGGLRESIQSQLFINGPKTTSFRKHWDPYDVFALKIFGKRNWKIHQPSRSWPLLVDIESAPFPDSDPVAEITVAPGDMLYIPRGWWHDVESGQRPSVHLTLAVPRRSGLDYFGWLYTTLREYEEFREDIPRHVADAELASYTERLKELVSREISTRNLRRYLEHCDEMSPAHARSSLPWLLDDIAQISDDARVVRLVTRVVISQTGANEVRLSTDRRAMYFDPAALPMLCFLCSRVEHTVGELADASGLNREAAVELLWSLVQEGLISISQEP